MIILVAKIIPVDATPNLWVGFKGYLKAKKLKGKVGKILLERKRTYWNK
jgi:hypothetical protein